MHHFIWQKNVDFMKPKVLICRFLVESWCLGVGRGVTIVYLFVCFLVCVSVFFPGKGVGEGLKVEI